MKGHRVATHQPKPILAGVKEFVDQRLSLFQSEIEVVGFFVDVGSERRNVEKHGNMLGRFG